MEKKLRVEGESYFRIEGEELKNFRLSVTNSNAQIGGEELKIFRESVSKRDAFSADGKRA